MQQESSIESKRSHWRLRWISFVVVILIFIVLGLLFSMVFGLYYLQTTAYIGLIGNIALLLAILTHSEFRKASLIIV